MKNLRVIILFIVLLNVLCVIKSFGMNKDLFNTQARINNLEFIMEDISMFRSKSPNLNSIIKYYAKLSKLSKQIKNLNFETKDIYVYKVELNTKKSLLQLRQKLEMLVYKKFSLKDENYLRYYLLEALKGINYWLYRLAYDEIGYYTVRKGQTVYSRKDLPSVQYRLPRGNIILGGKTAAKRLIGRMLDKVFSKIDDIMGFVKFDDEEGPFQKMHSLQVRYKNEIKISNDLKKYLKDNHPQIDGDLEQLSKLVNIDYFKNLSFSLENAYEDNPDISFSDLVALIKSFLNSTHETIKKQNGLTPYIRDLLVSCYSRFFKDQLLLSRKEIIKNYPAIKADDSSNLERLKNSMFYYYLKSVDWFYSESRNVYFSLTRTGLDLSFIKIMDYMFERKKVIEHYKKLLEKDLEFDYRKNESYEDVLNFIGEVLEFNPFFYEMKFKNGDSLVKAKSRIDKFLEENKFNKEFLSRLNNIAHFIQYDTKEKLLPALLTRITDIEAQNCELYMKDSIVSHSAIKVMNNMARKATKFTESINKFDEQLMGNYQIREAIRLLDDYIAGKNLNKLIFNNISCDNKQYGGFLSRLK